MAKWLATLNQAALDRHFERLEDFNKAEREPEASLQERAHQALNSSDRYDAVRRLQEMKDDYFENLYLSDKMTDAESAEALVGQPINEFLSSR